MVGDKHFEVGSEVKIIAGSMSGVIGTIASHHPKTKCYVVDIKQQKHWSGPAVIRTRPFLFAEFEIGPMEETENGGATSCS